jgi:hypothetical protein
MTFTPAISLDQLAKLTDIYAQLVEIMPEHHDDNLAGFATWCVRSGYATSDPNMTADEIDKFMERAK